MCILWDGQIMFWLQHPSICACGNTRFELHKNRPLVALVRAHLLVLAEAFLSVPSPHPVSILLIRGSTASHPVHPRLGCFHILSPSCSSPCLRPVHILSPSSFILSTSCCGRASQSKRSKIFPDSLLVASTSCEIGPNRMCILTFSPKPAEGCMASCP